MLLFFFKSYFEICNVDRLYATIEFPALASCSVSLLDWSVVEVLYGIPNCVRESFSLLRANEGSWKLFGIFRRVWIKGMSLNLWLSVTSHQVDAWWLVPQLAFLLLLLSGNLVLLQVFICQMFNYRFCKLVWLCSPTAPCYQRDIQNHLFDRFELPILRGRDSLATDQHKEAGETKLKELVKLVDMCIIRRTSDILSK